MNRHLDARQRGADGVLDFARQVMSTLHAKVPRHQQMKIREPVGPGLPRAQRMESGARFQMPRDGSADGRLLVDRQGMIHEAIKGASQQIDGRPANAGSYH